MRILVLLELNNGLRSGAQGSKLRDCDAELWGFSWRGQNHLFLRRPDLWYPHPSPKFAGSCRTRKKRGFWGAESRGALGGGSPPQLRPRPTLPNAGVGFPYQRSDRWSLFSGRRALSSASSMHTFFAAIISMLFLEAIRIVLPCSRRFKV